MSKNNNICSICNDRRTSSKQYQRCGECWSALRKTFVRRYSEPPTPQRTSCRIWQGSADRDGYGSKGTKRVHRWVYESVYGPIPKDRVIMHLCDNPPCFRLEHLRLGTIAENNADRARKDRSYRKLDPHWIHKAGEDHTQAKLTEAQVAEIKRRTSDGCNQRALANEYGVCPATITNIKKGKVWGWVEPARS